MNERGIPFGTAEDYDTPAMEERFERPSGGFSRPLTGLQESRGGGYWRDLGVPVDEQGDPVGIGED